MKANELPKSLYDLPPTEVDALIAELGLPAYRANQLLQALYREFPDGFDDLRQLPVGLRMRIAERYGLSPADEVRRVVSADGNTTKLLLRMSDGTLIETVLMQYPEPGEKHPRSTVCVSTQAGCAMGCVFCATGQMGFARHLTSTEIFEQAALYARELQQKGERLSNVVLMGMGEPFHNYDAVLEAIRRLNRELGIGARHITVSTVGLAPRIRQFAEEGLQVTLAISLHAATDAERSALLPINDKWPLAELLDACRYYVEKTGRRISFEWALIAGKNDQPEEAERLGRLLKGLPCHVNLIPLNPTTRYDGAHTSLPEASRFVEVLARYGVPATVRVRRGIDIDAGCGQLKSTVLKRRAPASAPTG